MSSSPECATWLIQAYAIQQQQQQQHCWHWSSLFYSGWAHFFLSWIPYNCWLHIGIQLADTNAGLSYPLHLISHIQFWYHLQSLIWTMWPLICQCPQSVSGIERAQSLSLGVHHLHPMSSSCWYLDREIRTSYSTLSYTDGNCNYWPFENLISWCWKQLLNAQACSFIMFWSKRCAQSLVVSCKFP